MPPISLANLYQGPFSTLCVDFVNYKRSLGRKYTVEALGLKRFDQFTLVAGYKTNCLSKELVDQFIELRPIETPRNRELRRLLMKQFAVYLISLGYQAYVPPSNKRGRTTRYTPYIFTDAELSNFFKTVDNLEPMINSPYMHLVLPVLFRFLYGCGLRISEALNLKMADVDLTEGVLTIRHSKNEQERLIPLSPSLQICPCVMPNNSTRMKAPTIIFFRPMIRPRSFGRISSTISGSCSGKAGSLIVEEGLAPGSMISGIRSVSTPCAKVSQRGEIFTRPYRFYPYF